MSPLITTVKVRGSGDSVCSVLVGSLLAGLVGAGPPVPVGDAAAEVPGRAGSASGDVDAVHPAARPAAATQTMTALV
jgi:hydroxymethylglutaryl-CoA reductase